MAEKKTEMEMIRRVGSTVYKVRVRFSEDGRETMEDKILRMIRSETMANGETCGIMDVPQMSPLPERSA